MLQMPPQAVKFANTIFSLTLISMKDLFVSKGHNSVKYQTWTKSNLDLYLLVKYLCMQLQLCIYIPSKVREQKLKSSYFLSSGSTTLSKIIRPGPNLNLTCIFL